jgi:hypothetical protein
MTNVACNGAHLVPSIRISVVVSRDELQQAYESLLPLIRGEPRLS